jgi:hypothetical protein
VVAGPRKREFHIKIFFPIRPDIALGKNFPVYKLLFGRNFFLPLPLKEHQRTLSRKSLRRRFDSIFTHSSTAEKSLLN